MNWKKTNGKTVPSVVTMSYSDFDKLRKQARLGKLIQMLPSALCDKACKVLQDRLEG